MIQRTIQAVRRNHALEHATVALLLNGLHPMRVVARASGDGFYLWGHVDRDTLESAVHEALRRMKDGDTHLAVSPFCGTNLALGGFLAGTAALLASGRKRGLDRFSSASSAATLALIAAQPLGRLMQKHLTTSADVEHLQLVQVRSYGRSFYKVHTRWAPGDRPAAYISAMETSPG